MTTYYENETSGYNPDRFVSGGEFLEKQQPITSTITTKLKGKFWTAKQIFCDKLGIPSDVDEQRPCDTSDPEFEMLTTRFNTVQGNTSHLINTFGRYHRNINDLANAEQELSSFLKRNSHSEKPHVRDLMKTTSEALNMLSAERLKLLWPIQRIHHELSMFEERAVDDCRNTVDAAKGSHSEYRGSMLWMRSIKELDPERHGDRGINEFRSAQQTFKRAKTRFDQLKEDLVYKVDVLVDSRLKLLDDLTKEYTFSLQSFFESTSTQIEGIRRPSNATAYEIDVTEILKNAHSNKLTAPEIARVEEASSAEQKKEIEEEKGDLITMDEIDVEDEFISAFEDFIMDASAVSKRRLTDSSKTFQNSENSTDPQNSPPTTSTCDQLLEEVFATVGAAADNQSPVDEKTPEDNRNFSPLMFSSQNLL